MTDAITPAVLLTQYFDYKSHAINEAVPASTANESATRIRTILRRITAALIEPDGCGRRFDEYIATRYYTPLSLNRGGDVYGQQLFLDADLKSVTEILNGDGVDIVSSVTLTPINQSNKTSVIVNPGTYWAMPSGNTQVVGAISVTGTWGYRGRWSLSGATVSGSLDDSSTTVAVSDGTLFEAGMLLRVDSEYLLVESINNNDLTVVRGHNGSTAVTHTDGTAIYRFYFDDAVVNFVLEYLDWYFSKMGSPFIGQAQIGDQTVLFDLANLPSSLRSQKSRLSWKPRIMGA